ncbi:hypothetical protein L9H26_12265 [Morganella psychrotolerans]|uniref:Uncharacterized protein n=1 Tax=Morganella psychrotolerans TaxID=368603 RepID=A0A5M9R5F7_9GAMM|nr:hypothetical protein [Morganella psychrotolerans]KAA8715528.1 hypothetical protein F4V73_11210 [Morganella psychrotolerans]OBU05567.1 hypothetical protein AYY16_10035 [Morganella psychrotolerans]
MGPVQGTQGHQAIQTLNNDTYGSTGSSSSSSYVSSSGIKSILSNAWNAIKSAFSNVLSSFGNHLAGQQGSAKPGREITIDMASRPLPQIPGKAAESEYAEISFGTAEQAVVKTTQELLSRSLPPIPVDDDGGHYAAANFDGESQELPVLRDESTSEPIYATVNKHAALSEAEQAKINLWEGITDGCGSEAPPVPGYTDRTPIYTQTPENDLRGESDYADPRELLFGEDMLRQRYMSEMMKNQ